MKKELSKLKILVTRDIPELGLNLLRQKGCELKVQSSDNPFSVEEFKIASQWADVVLASSKEKITEDYLAANPQLLMLSQYSAGYDNVDVEACNKRKLPLGHTPQAMNRATSDIAFGLMVATARNFFFMHKKLERGEISGFKPRANLGQEMYGKTLGIFGLGAIGFEMARKCKLAYDMNIIYCNRSENQKANTELNATLVSFEDLLASSDVISVHSNLSEQTHQIFNKEAFSKMKTSSIFINTSRGKVHDEKALIQALQNGEIWGAGLDVSDPEPMEIDNPLLNMPNVCVLPHIGSATVEARDEMARLSAENIIQYFEKGKMIHCVNPEVL
ncbi:D-glycerate dehydrogenase [uncultured Arcticibacterium sp.]|uniref:2-hydroxyacid dehydrogenase n=1 Tax=uncultured Arcticibacterium sp. TaxID=2173042 RepID=UPI0030F79A61